MNIFEDEFVRQEIESIQPPTYDKDGIVVKYSELSGRVDDYFNKNFRAGELECPIFSIDGEVWMSLTPMEVQSNFFAIAAASGRVATAGLGLGYVALSCAQSDNVEEMVVFEQSEKVIQYFNDSYKDREGFEKITIIQGDARELIPKYTNEHGPFDYLYSDIYLTLCSEAVLDDLQLFTIDNYCADSYSFWGKEKLMLDAFIDRRNNSEDTNDITWTHREREFISQWMQAEMPNGTKLTDLYSENHHQEFCEDVIEKLAESKQSLCAYQAYSLQQPNSSMKNTKSR